MITLIGHGPSIIGSGLGPWIDQQTVVRLKLAPPSVPMDWGARTDYFCARHPDFFKKSAMPGERWLFPAHAGLEPGPAKVADVGRWMEHFHRFVPERDAKGRRMKPSTGCCAAYCAIEFLGATELALVGFDNWFGPERGKWSSPANVVKYHDYTRERASVEALGVRLEKIDGSLSRI